MPFLLAEILDFQGSAHLIGVGSLSKLIRNMEKIGRLLIMQLYSMCCFM